MSKKNRVIIDGEQYEQMQKNSAIGAGSANNFRPQVNGYEYNPAQFMPYSTYTAQQNYQIQNEYNENFLRNENANKKYMSREEALNNSDDSRPATPYDEVPHSGGPVSDHLQSFYNEAYINERERLNAMFGRLDVYPITPKERIVYAEPDMKNYVTMAKYKKLKKGLKILGIALVCALLLATAFALVAFHVFG